MEEQLSIIKNSIIKKRIKREIEQLVESNICKMGDVSIEINNGDYETKLILHLNSKIYEFYIHKYYPFRPPKIYINNKQYLSCHTILSNNFRAKLREYAGIDCFCCETMLCSDNWSPKLTIKDILEERDKYKNACREVVHRIIVNVIIRKYLNNDINIIQWLY